MKKIELNMQSEIKLKNIIGFLKRKVTKFGTSAKVNCPKEYLGKIVYLIITDDE